MSDVKHHIVFVGLMGTGKTTVGRLVAHDLGMAQTDSDVDIEAATGRTVRQISETDGPDIMHDHEERQLLRRLSASEPHVIGAAASTIERAVCRQAMHDSAMVVWLRMRLEHLVAHFERESHRPILATTVDDMFRRQIAHRYPLYADVADLALDADEDITTPQTLADIIVAEYRRRRLVA